MNEDNIMAMFLKIITEYDYLEYEEDELKADFMEILEMAVVEVQLQGLMLEVDFDADFGFSEELSRNMAYILAHACALVWVTPKVNSAELLATALTSTDFTMFSPANRLQSCLKLKLDMEAKLNSLISAYDFRIGFKEIQQALKDGDK